MNFNLINNIIQVNESVRRIPTLVGDDENRTVSTTIAQLSDHNVDFDEHHANIIDTIDVTVDLLQRLYSGIYILNYSVSNCGREERGLIYQQTLQSKLIDPLTRQFPDMAMFDFNASYDDDGHLILTGNNTFTDTLLNAIQMSLVSPIAEKTAFGLEELDD